jgi:ribonuclease BN (tRNA processing enzyme)
VLALTMNAALVIVDTTYTDEELPDHAGWGHSSWQQGVRLAKAAGAKQLCLFHHDPDHDDAMMDKIKAAAETARPGTIVAREGMQVDL